MQPALVPLALLTAPLVVAAMTVDVNSMPTVVFTGDSQTCGRTGAMDYPQMLSREMPVRVINTAVGGTNTRHLLTETTGGTAVVRKGEKVVHGTKVGWYAGPYPGQMIRLGTHEYTIDRIEVISYADREVNLWITQPAEEEFSGTDYSIEPGWRVRVEQQNPDYVCFMYSVNDTGYTSEQFLSNIAEITRRTRELGAQPIFLSGVPFMDEDRGGTHPGSNSKVRQRADDLAHFCGEQNIPYGNVFEALMALDKQSTSVWTDTVHPTTEGSAAILNALRHLFGEIGLARNPLYVRAYRAVGDLQPPDRAEAIAPFTTGQPDFSAANTQDEKHFDLAAITTRDEYGLIADVDGRVVHGDTAIVLQFGVGDLQATEGARARLVAPSPVEVFLFDWVEGRWRTICEGTGELVAALSAEGFRAAFREGVVWLAVRGDETIALDYAGLEIGGDAALFVPQAADGPIAWPPEEMLKWAEGPDNLIANGDFTRAEGDVPAGWQRRGAKALYVRQGVVTQGAGEFIADKRPNLFSAAEGLLHGVRPLDMLEVLDGPDHARGRFLVSQTLDEGTLRLRRWPKEPVGGLSFRVLRSSGCGAVAGGCAVEACGASCWQTTIPALTAGRYRLSLYYRAYDPLNMRPGIVPGRLARVQVSLGPDLTLARADDMQASYQWQYGALEFTIPGTEDVVLRLGAADDTPVQYTGIAMRRAAD